MTPVLSRGLFIRIWFNCGIIETRGAIECTPAVFCKIKIGLPQISSKWRLLNCSTMASHFQGEKLAMLADILLSDPNQLYLEKIMLEDYTLELMVSAKSLISVYPQCGTLSSRVHSRYQRTLADLPCTDCSMRLLWNIHRFFCDHPECSLVTYSKQILSVADRYARRTHRIVQQQTGIAFEVGGELGARLTISLRAQASPDTLLRFIRTTPEESLPAPEFLGVDNWAIRKGYTHGTIFVDLETHQTFDLLSERSSEAFVNWLQKYTSVRVIFRDWSKEYARGAS